MPERTENLAGHHAASERADIDRPSMVGVVAVPLGHPDWHPLAREWYRSLAVSGQSRYYEPSDWIAAMIGAHTLSLYLTSKKPSSEMYKAIQSVMADLGTTEGARRRLGIEIQRAVEEEGDGDDATILTLVYGDVAAG